MKIVKKNSNEDCDFYSREKSLYVAWACFRNAEWCLNQGTEICKVVSPAMSVDGGIVITNDWCIIQCNT